MRKIDFLDLPLHVLVSLWIMRQFVAVGELDRAHVIYTDPQQEISDLMGIVIPEYRYFNGERLSRGIDMSGLGLIERIAVKIYARYVEQLHIDLASAQRLDIVHTGMFRRQ